MLINYYDFIHKVIKDDFIFKYYEKHRLFTIFKYKYNDIMESYSVIFRLIGDFKLKIIKQKEDLYSCYNSYSLFSYSNIEDYESLKDKIDKFYKNEKCWSLINKNGIEYVTFKQQNTDILIKVSDNEINNILNKEFGNLVYFSSYSGTQYKATNLNDLQDILNKLVEINEQVPNNRII